ncbi:MAG: phosphodiesterase [Flavobacteriales bacterium]|nr:phosphodiesterase [Flavobacteriales bacterium]
MKIAFISDIHGSAHWCEKAFKEIDSWGADVIAVLGDVMYHGPRNPLPDGYNPMRVAEILNAHAGRIIAVRGNCDSEVDQMQISYPMMGDSARIICDNRTFFLSHGHIFAPDNLPPLPEGAVFVFGHIHTMVAEKVGDVVCFNPSSISLPKEEHHTWGRYADGVLEIVNTDGNILKRLEL